jgi:hypothetical protein
MSRDELDRFAEVVTDDAADDVISDAERDGWDADDYDDEGMVILSGLMWDWPGTDWDTEPPF